MVKFKLLLKVSLNLIKIKDYNQHINSPTKTKDQYEWIITPLRLKTFF